MPSWDRPIPNLEKLVTELNNTFPFVSFPNAFPLFNKKLSDREEDRKKAATGANHSILAMVSIFIKAAMGALNKNKNRDTAKLVRKLISILPWHKAIASLSFLGFGVSPPTPDWGLMISNARGLMSFAYWAVIAPIVGLSTLIIGINLTADAFAKALGIDRSTKAPV